MTYRHPLPLLGGQPTLFDRIGAETLTTLLYDFYDCISQDELLGPVFISQLGPFPKGGWPVHLMRIEGFWRSITHGPNAYRGKPGPAHMGLGIQPQHFDRWLQLWQESCAEHLPEAEAAQMLALAQRMRPTLQRFTEQD